MDEGFFRQTELNEGNSLVVKHCFEVIAKVTKELGVADFRVVSNCGVQAGQSVVQLPAGADVDLGNHQEVDGGLGVDVVKGHAFLIPIDDVGGDLPLHALCRCRQT